MTRKKSSAGITVEVLEMVSFHIDVESQKAVTAYLKSKHTSFGFAQQYYSCYPQ